MTITGVGGCGKTRLAVQLAERLLARFPSQVYFPKQLSAAQRAGDEEPYQDEDVAAVRKIFAMLADAVRDTKRRLQIIVLDHATDTVWGDVEGLTVAAQWRDGAKLIPDSWPSVGT